MNIVGRGVTLSELQGYLNTVPRTGWSPRFVVVHNTDAPDLALYASWQTRLGWTGEQWLRNLKNYYEGKGWSGGPHLFVAPDKIWLFTPLWRPGVHSPSWNHVSWGVETVGNFDREPFEGEIRTNLVGALAVLHGHLGLDPSDYRLGVRGLHLHREDPLTTHRDCPGRNVVKAELLSEVLSEMDISHASPSAETQAADISSLPPLAVNMRWVQEHLNALGEHLAVDNVAGPHTRAAVRRFQAKHGLRVDGIAGSLTRLALLQAASSGSGH